MKRILSVAAGFCLAAATATAAPIFTDNFNDGSYNNPPSSGTNPTWQVLLLPGLNNGHDERWDVTTDSPIEPTASVRWSDAPCQGQPGLGGACFPAGVLYVDPAPNRPGQVGSYFIRFTTKIDAQAAADLNPLEFGGDHFSYASAPGILLFPPDANGLAGGYAAGLFYNAGPDVDPVTSGFQDDPADDRVEVGILYLEGNVSALTLTGAILLREPANISTTDFFGLNHVVQMNVRSNRYIELAVDGEYYGRADTSGTFTDANGDPFTPLIRPQNTQDVAMVALAGNVNRYDLAEYNNTPPADANSNGIPDIFSGAPDADCDGISDASDPDDDNDGVADFEDTTFDNATDGNGDGFPDDLDSDGFPDLCDSDADGDGCLEPQDTNLDPAAPDCSATFGCGSGSSHDCDGDSVANDCELACAPVGDVCDPTKFCDTKAPFVKFTQPARGSIYVQDSMGQFVVQQLTPTTVSSITVKAQATDSGSGVASVSFLVSDDGVNFSPVDPAALNPAAPPVYSFRYQLDGTKTGSHSFRAIATDNAGNTAQTTTTMFVVDASAVTDQIATDVTDQYAVIIDPQNPAIVGSNGYAIRSKNGAYTIRYRIIDYGTVFGAGKVVPTCHDNVLFVIDAEGGVSGFTTPGAFPGFWHDPAYTVTNKIGSCANGIYTATIPAAELSAQVSQPVTFWAYVDVQDRASTTSPGGGVVDSASGFFSILKTVLLTSPLADRLDEMPTPVFIQP